MSTKPTTEPDRVDGMIDSWAQAAPELPGSIDLEVEAAVQRIHRLHRHIQKRMKETLAELGLNYGEWGVLAHLSLSGPPHRDSPGHLAEMDGLSSGAMTSRLDQLEKAGLVRRLPDPDDRRALHVELTEKGRKLWLDAVGVQGAKEAALAAALTGRELAQLNALMRKVLAGLEEPC
jgi:DNA-binding MarR family transcriptional regulator